VSTKKERSAAAAAMGRAKSARKTVSSRANGHGGGGPAIRAKAWREAMERAAEMVDDAHSAFVLGGRYTLQDLSDCHAALRDRIAAEPVPERQP